MGRRILGDMPYQPGRRRRSLHIVGLTAGVAAVVIGCASPGFAARVLDVATPRVALGATVLNLPDLAPGDSFAEPITIQNRGTTPMAVVLNAGELSDSCSGPTCVEGTDAKWLTFAVVGQSGSLVWQGSLAELESGVTLSPQVSASSTASLTLTTSLPLATPNAGEGEALELTLSGTGVPVGAAPIEFSPGNAGGTNGSGSTGVAGPGPGSGPGIPTSGPSSGAGGDAVASLSVVDAAEPPVVPAGGRVGFSITISNAGPVAATGIGLEDQLPGTDSLSWSLAGGSVPGHVASHVTPAQGCAVVADNLSCSDLDVPAGSTLSVHVESTPVPINCATATVTNAVSVSAPNARIVSGPTSATAALTCVLGESLQAAPTSVIKAPVHMSGALPFTGLRLDWALALVIALVMSGTAMVLSGRMVVRRAGQPSDRRH